LGRNVVLRVGAPEPKRAEGLPLPRDTAVHVVVVASRRELVVVVGAAVLV